MYKKSTELTKEQKQKTERFLEKGSDIRRQIKTLEGKIELYEERANSLPGTDYEKDRVQTSPSNTAPFARWVNLKLDTERQRDTLLIDLKAAEEEVLDAILTVDDLDVQKVLMLRFADDYTFEAISEIMDSAKSRVFYLYRLGLFAVWTSVVKKLEP